jgi:hypothetical protein
VSATDAPKYNPKRGGEEGEKTTPCGEGGRGVLWPWTGCPALLSAPLPGDCERSPLAACHAYFRPISKTSGNARALLISGIFHTRVIICQSPSWVYRTFVWVGSKGESIEQNHHLANARHLASSMHSAPTKRWGLESRARFSRRSASASKRASAAHAQTIPNACSACAACGCACPGATQGKTARR